MSTEQKQRTVQAPVKVTPEDNSAISVNRTTSSDSFVVVSWTNAYGQREAAPLTPAEAQRMAFALIVASQIVGGSI